MPHRAQNEADKIINHKYIELKNCETESVISYNNWNYASKVIQYLDL